MDLRQFIERYGVALGVVLALVATIAILPGNADNRVASDATEIDLSTGGFIGGEGGGGFEGGAGGDGGDGFTTAGGGGGGSAVGGGGAGGAGRAGGGGAGGAGGGQAAGGPVFGRGPNCNSRGFQKGLIFPCVDWTPGTPNGGATFRGVTEDKILVVRWLGQLDPGTQAILEGGRLSDSQQQIQRTYEALRRFSNNHYETYGREVVFLDMQAGGPSESDEAMRADAIKIVNDHKAFAVLEGNPAAPVPNVLARELAQRGVICICTTSASQAFYTELPPLIFSALPTMDDYAEHVAEYIAKKLWNKPAEFAGDTLNPTQGFRTQNRKFGLLYLEGARGRVDPEGKRARDAFAREFARYGMKFAVEASYIYDPGRNQQDVSNLIARFKGEGVTTIVPIWDPLYPILITREATRQQYFPEWFISGTGLSDTTTAGRLYDQQQWRHAFGISPLWVTWERVENSYGYRQYKHGDPDTEPGVLVNIYAGRFPQLFGGIHMAGPNLTNETFVRGILSMPKVGGEPRSPLFFMTRERPAMIKDFTEVWYGAEVRGPDERGDDGLGMVMKANMGQRYERGQWTNAPTKAFDPNNAIAVSDDPALGGEQEMHEADGHRHTKRCLSCPN